MRFLALAAIRGYQRYISPYKGFCCAYRTYAGRASCSALGFRAIQRYGVFSGIELIKQRTALCAAMHRSQLHSQMLNRQRGVCDLSCDLPCDGPDLSDTCNFLNSCNCSGCDWPSRRKNDDLKYVDISPQTRR